MERIASLTAHVTVALPQKAAFERLTDGFGAVWPAQFSGAGQKTDVVVTHRSWERHGEVTQAYRDDFDQAWPMALERFQQHAQP